MAKAMKLMAAIFLAAAISELVLADADAELKAKLGAAVIPLLRKAMKIEDNWITGQKIIYVCKGGTFDHVTDTATTFDRGSGTLADAQEACSTDGIKNLLANNAGGSVTTEQECKTLVEKTLSDPVLCGRKEQQRSLQFKDLEGVRALFVGAARYQALADAVKLKAQTKLSIVDKDTCPEGMKFCYQCWIMTGFVALSCIPTSGKCSNDEKPQGDSTKMFTIDDIDAICKTPTMHETQKECKAFLEHVLYDASNYCSYNKINKLSEMLALIKPPTAKEPVTKSTKDDIEYYSGSGYALILSVLLVLFLGKGWKNSCARFKVGFSFSI